MEVGGGSQREGTRRIVLVDGKAHFCSNCFSLKGELIELIHCLYTDNKYKIDKISKLIF